MKGPIIISTSDNRIFLEAKQFDDFIWRERALLGPGER